MLSWSDFARGRPDLAAAGQELLYEYGVGLAFLSTVRKDGGPRGHSICTIICAERLFALLIPSPKLKDLRRDPRYALHSHPCADNEDAFYDGRGAISTRPELRASVERQFLAERDLPSDPFALGDQTLVEFLIETCLVTRTTGHGDTAPVHTIWHAT